MNSSVVIMCFDKNTEGLIYSEDLPYLTADELREILMLSYDLEDPEVIYDYEISEKNVAKLCRYTDHEFDFKKGDYFIGRRN